MGCVGKSWGSKDQGVVGWGKGTAGRGNHACKDRSGKIIHENQDPKVGLLWGNFQQWSMGTRGFADGEASGDRGASF